MYKTVSFQEYLNAKKNNINKGQEEIFDMAWKNSKENIKNIKNIKNIENRKHNLKLILLGGAAITTYLTIYSKPIITEAATLTLVNSLPRKMASTSAFTDAIDFCSKTGLSSGLDIISNSFTNLKNSNTCLYGFMKQLEQALVETAPVFFNQIP